MSGAEEWPTGAVAFVTGGASGMGASIVGTFAAQGIAVVFTDVQDEPGEALAESVRAAGGAATFVHADVSSSEEVASAVAAAVDAHGRLDCAVNAAGIEFERVPLHELDEADFDRIIAVNLRGVFLSLKHELAAMIAVGHGGSIVNIASTNSFRPGSSQTAYTASKHGVYGLTKSAAVDYGRYGIRVNAICPGTTDTPMLRNAMARRNNTAEDVIKRLTVLGRFGEPSEIAAAALWLCSPASSYTTGHALAVDGGLLAR